MKYSVNSAIIQQIFILGVIVNLSPLDWHSLSLFPNLTNSKSSVSFFDFQTHAQKALETFIQSDLGSLLILKTEILPEYINEIEDYLTAKSIKFSTQIHFNYKSLFGYDYYDKVNNENIFVPGAITEAQNNVLIVSIRQLLTDSVLWDTLKQALLFGNYFAYSEKSSPYKPSMQTMAFKLLLLGDREDISTLYQYDNSLYEFAHYAEIVSYLSFAQYSHQQWADYVLSLANKFRQQNLKSADLATLMNEYVRESESKDLISISPSKIKKDLSAILNRKEENAVLNYFEQLEKQSAILNQYNLDDILANQIAIFTEGEEVGQINGLSVVEFEGVPYAFGEPLRISCNIQIGEGEISDIERKAELGGNLHSKGIMLAQSCLADLLEFPTQLPFSASIAFEQSYGEIDGDSSSLAIFCILISALAKLPLPQGIAVTGAIDQFGNILSVGGVNQKIEGFFALCEARGLTGKQGVLIPSVCISHLSLRDNVIQAVKNGQFSIWTADNVIDAIEFLLQQPFYLDEEKSLQECLFDKIHQQIEESQKEKTSGHFWQKFGRLVGLGG